MTRIRLLTAVVVMLAPLAARAESWFDPDGTFHEHFESTTRGTTVTYDRVTNPNNTKTEITEEGRTAKGRLVFRSVNTATRREDGEKEIHEESTEFHADGVTPKKKEIMQLVEEGRYTLTRQAFRKDGTLKRERVYDTLPREDAPDRRFSAKASAITFVGKSGNPIVQLGSRAWRLPGGKKDGRAPILKFGKAAARAPEARPRGQR